MTQPQPMLAALTSGGLILPEQERIPQYKFLAVDLMSMQVLEQLPVTEFTASLKLNAPGDFNVQVQMEGFDAARRRALIEATEPNRTAVYAERNGNLIGGWVIYKRDRAKNPMPLVGAGLLSLLDPLVIRGFGGIGGPQTGLAYTSTDQMDIVRDLVAKQMLLESGGFPIEFDDSMSGVTRSIGYDGTKLMQVGDAITDLSEMDQGLDYDIDPEYTPDGNIRNVLRLGYPRRGRENVLNLDYPGDTVSEVAWPEDGTKAATHVYAAGSGEGSARSIRFARNENLIVNNYPRRVMVNTYSTQDEPVNLQARADADAKTARAPVVTPTVSVLADTDPPIGSYMVGDDVTLRLNSPGFPPPEAGGPGLVTTLRITEIGLRPPLTGAEYVDLTLADVIL